MKLGKRSSALLMGLALAAPLFSQGALERGKELYELKCGRCHSAYAPQKYSTEEWKTIMADMGTQSGLTKDSEKSIMEYLTAEAGKGLTGGLPTRPVVAGYLYTEFFSGPAMTDTFDIHYLNLMISGRLHDRVSYRAEFEFEHGGGEEEPPFIEWAYLDVRLLRNTGVRVGAILTPFNRFDDFHAPLENFLVTRPQTSTEIGSSAWKEVGIDVHGNVSLSRNLYLNYDAYLINGLGAGSRLRNSRQYRDNNDAKSLGFRLSGIYADRWELGASYYRGMWDDEGQNVLRMYGFHFLGKLGGFDLYAEYSNAVSENPLPLVSGEMDGYFVQLSYLFEKKIRPTIRYGTLDYLDPGNLLGRDPTDFDARTVALGLNYYLTSAIVFKLEYDLIMEGDRKEPAENNILALQAAVRF
jgi:hypothetical protein